jgi:hypothetical protein
MNVCQQFVCLLIDYFCSTFALVISYKEFSRGFRWAWAGHINFWWTSYCVSQLRIITWSLLCYFFISFCISLEID